MLRFLAEFRQLGKVLVSLLCRSCHGIEALSLAILMRPRVGSAKFAVGACPRVLGEYVVDLSGSQQDFGCQPREIVAENVSPFRFSEL
jgi:hypothetical protein